ncbi:MAG: hypothetical protein EP302_02630 [Bacteroidetes bacterium]|jgi:hypothetical protein|nr:MAG: hypothetical protein EP302_02630 [Bacteroidota bacterium]
MENKLFKKLNYKGQTAILVLNYPNSFEPELESMKAHATILRRPEVTGDPIEFALVFGKTLREVEELTRSVGPRLGEDAIFWFCYPKQSSKKYTCEFNRDSGWSVMAEFDLEPVRQVAIDTDWSALRFRHVNRIKKFTRRESMALTQKGKARIRKEKPR